MSYSSPAKTAMESILQRHGLLRKWSRTMEFAREMREASGRVYARGEDAEAIWCRQRADELDRRAKILRKEYDAGKEDEVTWEDLSALLIQHGGWRVKEPNNE